MERLLLPSVMVTIGALPPPEKNHMSNVVASGRTTSPADFSVVSTGTHPAPRRTRCGEVACRSFIVPSGWANVCENSVLAATTSTGDPYRLAKSMAVSSSGASLGVFTGLEITVVPVGGTSAEAATAADGAAARLAHTTAPPSRAARTANEQHEGGRRALCLPDQRGHIRLMAPNCGKPMRHFMRAQDPPGHCVPVHANRPDGELDRERLKRSGFDGGSLTGGCVVRGVQAVLRPPSTPSWPSTTQGHR